MTTKTDIEQLFRRHYSPMYVLARRFVHDEELARDIVHDVFASLLRTKPAEVTIAYLMNGVRMACLEQIRNQTLRSKLNKFYALDEHEIEEEEWPDDETIALINRVIDEELTDLTRKIVRMRFEKRQTYKEISEEAGISEVAVYKHLRHAINVLRKKFSRS